jgi:hypothetical protein
MVAPPGDDATSSHSISQQIEKCRIDISTFRLLRLRKSGVKQLCLGEVKVIMTKQGSVWMLCGVICVLGFGGAMTLSSPSGTELSIGIEISDGDLYSIRGAQMFGPCTVQGQCVGIGITCTTLNGSCVSTDTCGACTGVANKSCANSTTTNCIPMMKSCCSPMTRCQLGSDGCRCKAADFTEQIGTRTDC